jgi:hypothetical protein
MHLLQIYSNLYQLCMNVVLKTNVLAPTVVESLFRLKTNFCFYQKATKGSSFCKLQKWFEDKKLETNGGIGSKK